MHHSTKDTLFFDGQCPLCSREIRTLSKLAKGRVNFVDIHQWHGSEKACLDEQASPDMPPIDSPDKQSLLKVLHLRKADGQWLKGFDANVAVWRKTNFGALFLIFRLPVLKQLAAALYEKWAAMRYTKLYGSRKEDGQCVCNQASE